MTGRWADGGLWGRRTGEKGLWLRREGWMRAPCGGRSWNWIVGGGHAQLHTWEGCRAAAEAEGLTAGSLFLCSVLPVGEAGVRLTVNLWLFQCEEFLKQHTRYRSSPRGSGEAGLGPGVSPPVFLRSVCLLHSLGPKFCRGKPRPERGKGFPKATQLQREEVGGQRGWPPAARTWVLPAAGWGRTRRFLLYFECKSLLESSARLAELS